jgi:hypothetical protein
MNRTSNVLWITPIPCSINGRIADLAACLNRSDFGVTAHRPVSFGELVGLCEGFAVVVLAAAPGVDPVALAGQVPSTVVVRPQYRNMRNNHGAVERRFQRFAVVDAAVEPVSGRPAHAVRT